MIDVGVLAADSGEFLEFADVDLRGFCFVRGELGTELSQGRVVKDQFVGDLDEDFVAQEQGDDFLGTRLVEVQSGEDVVESGNLQSGGGERLLDDLLGLGFFVFEGDAAAAEADEVACEFELLLRHKPL